MVYTNFMVIEKYTNGKYPLNLFINTEEVLHHSEKEKKNYYSLINRY